MFCSPHRVCDRFRVGIYLSGLRGCRCAQPPANFSHPFRMPERGCEPQHGGGGARVGNDPRIWR